MCIIICLWSVTMIKTKQKILVMQLLSPLILLEGLNKEIFLFLALTKYILVSEFVDVKSVRLKKKTGFCVTYSLEFHFCKNSPFCL
jgi:hypothetical protein